MPLAIEKFAQFVNDPHLRGTIGLQGMVFADAQSILNNYLKFLSKSYAEAPQPLLALQPQFEQLTKTDNEIRQAYGGTSFWTTPVRTAETIAHTLTSLPPGESFLLPGGWTNSSGGHAMLYRFTRLESGYQFTVFNTGGGIQYHAKRSSHGQELYNIEKIWQIPEPNTPEQQKELGLFVDRLLRLQYPSRQPANRTGEKVANTEKTLYEKVLPTLAYLNAVEVNTVEGPLSHNWIPGQISGTCSPSVMLSVLGTLMPSKQEWLEFILPFRIYLIQQFSEPYLNGQSKMTAPVAEQLRLAVDDSLAMLTDPSLMTHPQKQLWFEQLTTVQSRMVQIPVIQESIRLKNRPVSSGFLTHPEGMAEIPPTKTHLQTNAASSTSASSSSGAERLPITLENIHSHVDRIRQETDLDIRYLLLEQLILALPENLSDSPFLAGLDAPEHMKSLEEVLNDIQIILNELASRWSGNERTQTLHALGMFVLDLQAEAYNRYTTQSGLPSFQPFHDAIMKSLSFRYDHNPFLATLHPAMDTRLTRLHKKYDVEGIKRPTMQSQHQFYQDLLNMEPELNQELKQTYIRKFGSNTSKLHQQIRDNHFESLFMIAEHLQSSPYSYARNAYLDTKFQPLIKLVDTHLLHEIRLSTALGPFFNKWNSTQSIILSNENDHRLELMTPVNPERLVGSELSSSLTKSKYDVKSALVRQALNQDFIRISGRNPHIADDNDIQLTRFDYSSQTVSSKDFDGRDYLYLRSVPEFQFDLTLDYFTRQPERLANQDVQQYIEANLFQPGAIATAVGKDASIELLDRFIAQSYDYYNTNGYFSRTSLFVMRIDFLMTRYLLESGNPKGQLRASRLLEQLETQLNRASDPGIRYVIQQYRFLLLSAKMESNEAPENLLVPACDALIYINSNTSPNIMEDASNRREVARALAVFKTKTEAIDDNLLREAALSLCREHYPDLTITSQLSGYFPIYTIDGTDLSINLAEGRFLQGHLSKMAIPYALQTHEMMRHLGLQHISTGFANSNADYFEVSSHGRHYRLYYRRNELKVQALWEINGESKWYELKPLNEQHPARSSSNLVVKSHVPEPLRDGSCDFWVSCEDRATCLWARQGKPVVYQQKGKDPELLDESAHSTGLCLLPMPAERSLVVEQLLDFEDEKFLLNRSNEAHEGSLYLPRYHLTFDWMDDGQGLALHDTGERVTNLPPPIHPEVAGLHLVKDDHHRYLVPLQRFYVEKHVSFEKGRQFSLIHDIHNTIPDSLQASANRFRGTIPMWHHEGSQQYVEFQMENGRPVAENVADALYLTYLYMASHQLEQAWETLEYCRNQLGGLSGDVRELQMLRWICEEMPHVLKEDKASLEHARHEPKRQTPPYVNLQLKALAMLGEYLNHDKCFDLPADSGTDATRNEQLAKLETKKQHTFLNQLPEKIYLLYTDLQRMRPWTRHAFTLSRPERQQLLEYYQRSQPQDHPPLGALGSEWVNLSLERLLEEQAMLQARHQANQPLTDAETDRLKVISHRIQALQPVRAQSTRLELVFIDLKLPDNSYSIANKYSVLNRALLDETTSRFVDVVFSDLPGTSISANEQKRVLSELSSNIDDNKFIQIFPALLQIAGLQRLGARSIYGGRAISETAVVVDPALKQKLEEFCIQTLRSHRHVPLTRQDSNVPLLCNLLYRVLQNPEKLNKTNLAKFDELVSHVRSWEVKPIEVYQAKDIYADILLDPQQRMTEISKPAQSPLYVEPEPVHSVLSETGIGGQLPPSQATALADVLKAFGQLHTDFNNQMDALGNRSKTHPDSAIETEAEAGKALLALTRAESALAERLLANKDLVNNMIRLAHENEARLQEESEQLWQEALTLANQGPDDPARAEIWRIEKQSGRRPTLTRADLQSLYCTADAARSIEITGLDRDAVANLHQRIHRALVSGIKARITARVATDLHKASTEGKPRLAIEITDILSRPEIPGLSMPATVLLQHEEQRFLRRRQASALESMLNRPNPAASYPEVVEKVIMGGGKTKVILPVAAEAKAHGDNLVVVEVPPALLAVNHTDLNRTSTKLFGKRVTRFEFNRDSDCSSKRLASLYSQFTDIMSSRCYMVTTAESMQSLQLKYIELLLTDGEHNEKWQQQVYWLDKISRLFRHHTDVIVDEMHEVLALKKKLIYTIGTPTPLRTDIIQAATLLYGYIDPGFIKSAPDLPEDYDWRPLRLDLARKLTEQQDSPLNQFVRNAVTRYGEKVRAELLAWLLDEADNEPEVVTQATEDERRVMGFLRGEINKQIPFSLVQKLYVRYGGSKRPNLSAAEESICIPYIGANVPNERTRIGVDLQAMNATMQKMLIEGVHPELFAERIEEWQKIANQELLRIKDACSLDEMPAARMAATILGDPDFRLSQVNTRNKSQMAELHVRYQFHQPLIMDLLREYSLKRITQDSAFLASDCFDHVAQFRSVQGISGTPQKNPAALSIRLACNSASSLGTDDYIFELLQSRQTAIASLDYNRVETFVAELLNRSVSPSRTRLLLDIRGTFTGVNNQGVAEAIAAHVRAHPDQFEPQIKQVLFFNEEQELCALNVFNPAKITLLGSSEESVINRLLGCKPEERFSFYDQVHTTGTDLAQWFQAHAIALVDDKLNSAQFVQGVSRLRELAGEQTLELSVPERLNGASLEYLRSTCKANDMSEMLAESPAAIEGQIRHLIRNELWMLILDLPSEDAQSKSVLLGHFSPLFENNPSGDYFARYGSIAKPQAAAMLLEEYRQRLEQLWHACLTKADMQAHRDDIERITATLQQVIERGLPGCPPTFVQSFSTEASEVEIQTEVQQEVETEVFRLDEAHVFNRRKEPYRPWPDRTEYKSHVSLLDDLCDSFPKNAPLFSDTLLVSDNFKHTWQQQDTFLNAFTKPVFAIWYFMEEGKLHAVLINIREIDDMRQKGYFDNALSWVSTTQNTLLAGNPPQDFTDDPKYQLLREQVRFFNGELAMMLQIPLKWIRENTEEKLYFFENALMPYRPESGKGLRQLKSALAMDMIQGFIHIATHPFNDFQNMNWQRLYPDILPAHAEDYKKLAAAFAEINRHWIDGCYSSEYFENKYQLIPSMLEYLQTHLDYMNDLSALFKQLRLSEKDAPLTAALTSEQRDTLFQFLQITPDYFASTSENPQLTWINMLSRLREHPAKPGEAWFGEMLLDIARTCNSDAQMENVFSAIKEFTRPVVAKLLDNRFWNEKYVPTIIRETSDAAVLSLLFKDHPHYQDTIKEILVSRPQLALDYLNESLNTPASLINPLLQSELAKDPNILAKMLLQQELDETILASQLANLPLEEVVSNTNEIALSQVILNKLLKNPSLPAERALRLINLLPTQHEETDLTLFIGDDATELAFNACIHTNKRLNIATLTEMINRVSTAEQINQLLARPEMTANLAQQLMTKPDYDGTVGNWQWITRDIAHLNEQQCLQIIPVLVGESARLNLSTVDSQILGLPGLSRALSAMQGPAKETACENLLLNPELSPELACALIDNGFISGEKIQVIVSSIIANRYKKPRQEWLAVFEEIISNYDNRTNAQTAFANAREVLSPSLILLLLQHEDLPVALGLHTMDLTPVIDKASEQQESEFISARVEYLNDATITKLVELAARSPAQINILMHNQPLAREDAYWRRISQHQLQAILLQSSNYDLINQALRYIDQPHREAWSGRMARNKAIAKDLATRDPSTQNRLNLAMLELREKIFQHAINAQRNPEKYEAAARATCNLHEGISEAMRAFEGDPAGLLAAATQVASDNMEALGVHRGSKQKLYDVLNVPLIVTAPFRNNGWRFFKANTDSVQKLKNILQILRDDTQPQNRLDR